MSVNLIGEPIAVQEERKRKLKEQEEKEKRAKREEEEKLRKLEKEDKEKRAKREEERARAEEERQRRIEEHRERKAKEMGASPSDVLHRLRVRTSTSRQLPSSVPGRHCGTGQGPPGGGGAGLDRPAPLVAEEGAEVLA